MIDEIWVILSHGFTRFGHGIVYMCVDKILAFWVGKSYETQESRR